MRTLLRLQQCFSSAAALALLIGANMAAAQQADDANERLTLRTYEVGDLVIHVPDYAMTAEGNQTSSANSPYVGPGGMGGGGGFGGGGGGYGGGGRGYNPMGAAPADGSGNPQLDPSQITRDDLRHVITRVIQPDTWAVNGEGDGQIEAIGSTLVVRHTEEAHHEIEFLLVQLREGSGSRRSVSIDARWLMLDSNDLDALVAGKDGKAPAPTLNRELLAKLTRRPTSLRGITNCFSGQAVYLVSGTRRNVVSGYIPVVGSLEALESDILRTAVAIDTGIAFLQGEGRDGGGGYGRDMGAGGVGVGYQPIVEKPNFGVHLEIRPTLMHGATEAVVDLTSTITFPGADPGAGQAANGWAAPNQAPNVDRLAVETQELATTLRVPLGEPVLVGGMSYLAPLGSATSASGSGAADEDGPKEMPQLYLVLEIR